jgi:hypothetical protein
MMQDYDVVVIGGGPSGVIAALAAAKSGMRTCLLERNSYIGGVAVTGLPWHGFASYDGEPLLKGIPTIIHKQLIAAGGATDILVCTAHGGYVSTDPEIVKLKFAEELESAGVSVFLYNAFAGLLMDGNKILFVRCTTNERMAEYRGRIFIDATGDGAVGAAAGCAFEKGDAQGYMQPVTMLLRLGNVDIGEFKRYIAAHPDECSPHTGFNASINCEHILNQNQFIFIGLPSLIKKANIEKGYVNTVDRISFTVNPVPGTVTINCVRQHNIDGTKNKDISKAEIAGRRQAMDLYSFFSDYIPGFKKSIVLCIGPQIGIRETRRFCGKTMLTGDMVEKGIIGKDSLCLGHYAVDIHDANSDGISFTPLKRPYGIPFGAFIPQTCQNLVFSGRNICTDRVAFAAMRVIGTCMAIGQASGIIAALAVQKNAEAGKADLDEYVRAVSMLDL